MHPEVLFCRGIARKVWRREYRIMVIKIKSMIMMTVIIVKKMTMT